MEALAEFFHIPIRQAPLASIGIVLIAFGLAIALLNWWILWTQRDLEKKKIDRNVSMVFLFGFSLPIGCLLIAPLRWHALWVWIIDPASLYLVVSLPLMLWEECEQRFRF